MCETSNVMPPAPAALPPDCAFRAGNPEIDTLIMGTACTAIGQFRCPVDHASFVDSGPISDPLFVFPRTAVWIQHEDARAFHSDPTLVTIYNKGQRYTRRASSHQRDRSDWFALSDDVARDVMAFATPSARDGERLFTRTRTASNAALYLRQRVLLQQARRGELSALELDERVIEIAHDVLAPRPGASSCCVRRTTSRRAAVADAARAMLAADPAGSLSLGALADHVDTSPFHLCRLFRAETGQTLRSYRNQLRCRLALEDLSIGASNISAIAHRYGFTSHSHFVRVARHLFGDAPGTIRQRL